eukprot:gene23252-46376_t
MLIHNCGVVSKCRPPGHVGIRCKNYYPFDECDRTYVDDTGYIMHRRDGRSRRVVLHNPRLLVDYKASINVQIIGGNIMAYLYKYFHRDHAPLQCTLQRVRQQVRYTKDAREVHEIDDYFTMRWTSSMEAAHRILGFEVHRRDPAVDPLGWHLPGEDAVRCPEGGDLRGAADDTVSTLQRYFWRPRGDRFAKLLYHEYFEKYCTGFPGVNAWVDHGPDDKGQRRWVWLRQKEHIFRLFTATPAQGETYITLLHFLRLLLKKRPAYSWDELKTVVGHNNGQPHEHYEDAAAALGLLSNEREYFDCFAELGMVATEVLRRHGKELLLDYSGRGKSWVLRTVAARARLTEKEPGKTHIVLAVASTGVAARDHDRGMTAHSMFQIPVNEHGEEVTECTCSVADNSARAALLRAADVVIWDELPMQHRLHVEAVDELLRRLRRDPRPFGGVTFIGAGDFRQTVPV